jgi:sporulation protein YlmC with PRC-barrel domain
MIDEPVPIAYAALQPGTPVQTIDGDQIGVVETVLVVEEVDVFDGLLVETSEGTRFVDADQIESIFIEFVRTRISAAEAAALPER